MRVDHSRNEQSGVPHHRVPSTVPITSDITWSETRSGVVLALELEENGSCLAAMQLVDIKSKPLCSWKNDDSDGKVHETHSTSRMSVSVLFFFALAILSATMFRRVPKVDLGASTSHSSLLCLNRTRVSSCDNTDHGWCPEKM